MKPPDNFILRNLVNSKYPNKGFCFRGSTRPISSLEGLEVNDVTHNITMSDFNTFKESELAKYDAHEYARKREREYPTIAELTIALYDTDDKAALETKRAAVKTKWPKDNSGPVE